MRKYITLVIALASLAAFTAGTAQGTSQTAQGWTITKAEKAAHHVRYVDSKEVADEEYDWQTRLAKKGHAVIKADCRSNGPSKDAYHFTKFLCKVTVGGIFPAMGCTGAGCAYDNPNTIGVRWGKGTLSILVTGRTTFRYSWV
jgi:hypothetical protein